MMLIVRFLNNFSLQSKKRLRRGEAQRANKHKREKEQRSSTCDFKQERERAGERRKSFLRVGANNFSYLFLLAFTFYLFLTTTTAAASKDVEL
jgi:hypothetical protein